jgi:hypothetical protein
MPDVSAPGYKKFLQLMGAPADRVFLFPPNTHDQIAITALAMEKAKSPMAVDWSKQIITGRQRPRAGSRRRRRRAEARARRQAGQLPGRRLDVRLHAERRPARTRHGAVDHQGRQERVRRIREALSDGAAQRPARGLKVLEFGQIAAGPFAGSLLADLGADVVKVERPDGGDDMRRWPPLNEGPARRALQRELRVDQSQQAQHHGRSEGRSAGRAAESNSARRPTC